MVTNRRTDVPAVYGKLRLLGSRAAPLVPRPWNADDPSALVQAHLPEARARRSLAAYYDRPLFPENFSHSASLDESGDDPSRTLNDWATFYEGSQRLVAYLAHGYNGAIVTVAADGGALYPSALLQATPRYDDGVFFHSGQDPLRKDVLELLLRMFDREGLRLVPTLQLSTPLVGLEADTAAERPKRICRIRSRRSAPLCARPTPPRRSTIRSAPPSNKNSRPSSPNSSNVMDTPRSPDWDCNFPLMATRSSPDSTTRRHHFASLLRTSRGHRAAAESLKKPNSLRTSSMSIAPPGSAAARCALRRSPRPAAIRGDDRDSPTAAGSTLSAPTAGIGPRRGPRRLSVAAANLLG